MSCRHDGLTGVVRFQVPFARARCAASRTILRNAIASSPVLKTRPGREFDAKLDGPYSAGRRNVASLRCSILGEPKHSSETRNIFRTSGGEPSGYTLAERQVLSFIEAAARTVTSTLPSTLVARARLGSAGSRNVAADLTAITLILAPRKIPWGYLRSGGGQNGAVLAPQPAPARPAERVTGGVGRARLTDDAHADIP